MPINMHSELIDRFEDGGLQLRGAIKTVSPDIAKLRSAPGTWSIHELVIHLADMDAIGIDRMKRVVAEERPALANADETAFIEKLHPHAQSMDEAAMLFDIGRRQWARVLRQLSDAEFQRSGLHSVDGAVTLERLLQRYADHLDHHLPFIACKLKKLESR
ncbi:MAG: DinB family protein [Phycisphaeraceae bacterium]|nr:DinB family protein [Phycisphaeraceae bacterium]